MHCPFCSQDQTTVLESRLTTDCRAVRRRRSCLKCKKRFTTFERMEGPLLIVVKRDGRREAFDRMKLAAGVGAAFHKRPVSIEQTEELVDRVERVILTRGSAEISSIDIGKEVLKRLKKIDKVAWLRFASVYLAFETLNDFERILDRELA